MEIPEGFELIEDIPSIPEGFELFESDEPSIDSRKSGRGIGGKIAEDKRQASIERTRAENPAMADLIENPDMNLQVGPIDTGIPIPDPLARGLIGVGKGMSDIGRAIGIGEQSEDQRQRDKQLTDYSQGAVAGEIIGQAAPFAAAGIGGSMLRGGKLAQTGIQSLIGSAEGGAIAKGTGGDQKQIAAGLLLGGLLGAGAEVSVPAVNRAGRALVAKIKGEPPVGQVLDDMGRPTPELESALESAGTTFDDFVRQSADDAGVQLPEAIVTASRNQQYDDVVGSISPDQGRLDAARELGMRPEDIPLAALTADQAAQELGGILSAIPGSRASTELDNYARALGQRADQYIEDIGGSLDRAAVDEDLFSAMRSDIQRIKAAEDELYSGLRANVGEGTLVNVTPIRNMLSARMRTRRGIQNLSQVERDVHKMISGGKVSYAQLDDKIKDIGAAIGKETDMYSNVRSSTLNKMYADLSKLRDGVLDVYGQKEVAQKAREIGAKRFGLQAATRDLFGKEGNKSIFPKIDARIKTISSGQAREFESLMEIIPKEYRETVLATSINRALTGGSDSAQQINATKFNRWFKNIKQNDTAYEVFKKYAPKGSIPRLEALASLAEGLSGVKSNRIRTGIVAETLKDFDNTAGIVDKLYGAGRAVDRATGTPVASNMVNLTTKLLTREKTPAIQAADSLMTSPEFKKAFVAAAESGTDSAKYRAQSAILKKSKFYKDYIDQLDGGAKSSVLAIGLIPWLSQKEDSQ